MMGRRMLIWALLTLPLAAALPGSGAEVRGPEKCAVHKVDLKPGEARILYGLVRMTRDQQEARTRLFPNAQTVALGGCVITKDSPKVRSVMFCPRCRNAEREWKRRQEQKPNEPTP